MGDSDKVVVIKVTDVEPVDTNEFIVLGMDDTR